MKLETKKVIDIVSALREYDGRMIDFEQKITVSYFSSDVNKVPTAASSSSAIPLSPSRI